MYINQYLLEIGCILFVYLSSMVIAACYKKDTSIANFTWGGGVLIVTLYTFFRMSNFLLRQILTTTMICLWSIRLIAYVYKRYTGKDPRFVGWKWQGFKALIINSFWVFGQIIMIIIMSNPVVTINMHNNMPHIISLFDIVGIVLWILGYCYESISDYQLSQFMKKPKNKGHVMQSGLWRYSRHPNYFGESIMWWGIYCVSLSVPYAWMTILAPVTITLLLVYITGIPLLENAMANNVEYQEYKKHTSKFIPWFPKE